MSDHDFMATALTRTEEALAFAGETIALLVAEVARWRGEVNRLESASRDEVDRLSEALEEAHQRIYELANGS